MKKFMTKGLPAGLLIALCLGVPILAATEAAAPEKVLAAVKSEWPEATVQFISQVRPGMWRYAVGRNVNGAKETLLVNVTRDGVVAEVTIPSVAFSSLPKAIAEAATAVAPDARFNSAWYDEQRLDENMQKLAKPIIRYRVSALLGAPAQVAPGVSLKYSRTLGVTVTEAGVVTRILHTGLKADELPKVLTEAVAELSPGGEIVSIVRLETLVDDDMAKLPRPMITYGISLTLKVEEGPGTVQLKAAEDGLVMEIATSCPPQDLPQIVRQAWDAAKPAGEDLFLARKVEKRVDKDMARLARPEVTYEVSRQGPQGKVTVLIAENGTIVRDPPRTKPE